MEAPEVEPEPAEAVMVHTWSLLPKDATPEMKARFWLQRKAALAHRAEAALEADDVETAAVLVTRAKVCDRMARLHAGDKWLEVMRKQEDEL